MTYIMPEIICRLCLNETKLMDIFDERLTNSEQLRNCVLLATGVEICREDVVTKYICKHCSDIAIFLYKYRKNAIANDKALKILANQRITEPRTHKDDISEFNNELMNVLQAGEYEETELKKPVNKKKTLCSTLAVHPTVIQLIKTCPKLKVPNDILKCDILPNLVLDRREAENWKPPAKQRTGTPELSGPISDMERFKLKCPGINIMRISQSVNSKEPIVETPSCKPAEISEKPANENVDLSAWYNLGKLPLSKKSNDHHKTKSVKVSHRTDINDRTDISRPKTTKISQSIEIKNTSTTISQVIEIKEPEMPLSKAPKTSQVGEGKETRTEMPRHNFTKPSHFIEIKAPEIPWNKSTSASSILKDPKIEISRNKFTKPSQDIKNPEMSRNKSQVTGNKDPEMFRNAYTIPSHFIEIKGPEISRNQSIKTSSIVKDPKIEIPQNKFTKPANEIKNPEIPRNKSTNTSSIVKDPRTETPRNKFTKPSQVNEIKDAELPRNKSANTSSIVKDPRIEMPRNKFTKPSQEIKDPETSRNKSTKPSQRIGIKDPETLQSTPTKPWQVIEIDDSEISRNKAQETSSDSRIDLEQNAPPGVVSQDYGAYKPRAVPCPEVVHKTFEMSWLTYMKEASQEVNKYGACAKKRTIAEPSTDAAKKRKVDEKPSGSENKSKSNRKRTYPSATSGSASKDPSFKAYIRKETSPAAPATANIEQVLLEERKEEALPPTIPEENDPFETLTSEIDTQRIRPKKLNKNNFFESDPSDVESIGANDTFAEDLLDTVDEEVSLHCSYCNKMFGTQRALTCHERTHRNCSICKGIFRSEGALNHHQQEICFKSVMANPPRLHLTRVDEQPDVVKRFPAAFAPESAMPSTSDSAAHDVLCISDEDDDDDVILVHDSHQMTDESVTENEEFQQICQIFQKYRNVKFPMYSRNKSTVTKPQVHVKHNLKNQIVLANMFPELQSYRVPVELIAKSSAFACISYMKRTTEVQEKYCWKDEPITVLREKTSVTAMLTAPTALLTAPSALLTAPSALLTAPSALLTAPSALLTAPAVPAISNKTITIHCNNAVRQYSASVYQIIAAPTEKLIIDSPTENLIIDTPTENLIIDSPTGKLIIDSPTENLIKDTPAANQIVDTPEENHDLARNETLSPTNESVFPQTVANASNGVAVQFPPATAAPPTSDANQSDSAQPPKEPAFSLRVKTPWELNTT